MFVQAALVLALAAPAPKVLVVSDSRGYVHASIPDARAAILRVPGIDAEPIAAAELTAERLRGADAVVFAVSNGDIPGDRRALRRFVRRGGGLAGFHSASGTFRSWPRWETLLGGRFLRHDAPATETVTVRTGHPAVRGVPRSFALHEEYYLHEPGVERRARVLARWGPDRRPLVWVRTPGRGRVFYDALGHFPATWTDPRHEALVRSGLRWVLRNTGPEGQVPLRVVAQGAKPALGRG
jgi:type 1 glutamine amidotransferase